ncbi:MAG: hypothetical protein IT557_05825 [Alphaproteobacteria bacterium]|nr:hypothetical protein [Alphaproteobacteria bacterium]
MAAAAVTHQPEPGSLPPVARILPAPSARPPSATPPSTPGPLRPRADTLRAGGFRAGAFLLGFALVAEGYLRAEIGFSLRPIQPLALLLLALLLSVRGLPDRTRVAFAGFGLALLAIMVASVALHAATPAYDREDGAWQALAFALTLPVALAASLLDAAERRALYAGLALGLGASAAFESAVWLAEILLGIAPPLAYENLAYLFGPATIRRLSAPYTGSNPYAAFCLLGLVWTLHLLATGRGLLRAALLLGLAAAQAVAIALSFTRSVWVLAALVLAARLLPLLGRARGLALLAALAGAGALLGWAGWQAAGGGLDLAPALAALADRASGDGDSGRLERWAAAWNDLAHAPLLGVGWASHIRAHNVWLALAADAGLPVALFVLGAALLLACRLAWRAGTDEARSALAMLLAGLGFMTVDTALLGAQTWLGAGIAVAVLADRYRAEAPAGRGAARSASAAKAAINPSASAASAASSRASIGLGQTGAKEMVGGATRSAA